MKKILITGFEPFGGEKINPAFEAVKRLPDEIAGAKIIKKEIPTVFKKGADSVIDSIEQYQPDYVLCIGQAGERSQITPEWVGINFQNARIADNEGNMPMQKRIVEEGPEAYFTMLPVFRMVERMKENSIPANVSYSAGTYVCNDVMYSTIHACKIKYQSTKAGFMHVPFATEQTVNHPAGTPGMNLSDIVRAIQISIEAILEGDVDIQVLSGEIQ